MVPTIIAPMIAKTMPVYDVPSELASISEIGTVGSSVCPSTTRKLVAYTSGLNASSDEAKTFSVFAPTPSCKVSSSVNPISDKPFETDFTPDVTVSPLEFEMK